MTQIKSILPPNATQLQKDIEAAMTERLLSLDIDSLRWLNNPDKCEPEFLPWLAWAMSVDVSCKMVQDTVPDYIWQEVSHGAKKQKSDATIVITDANAQNDISYIAFLSQDYGTALDAGKKALKLAETNKQRGAACYNIGITYLAKGLYGNAIKNLEQSVTYNKTNAAESALNDARQKQSSSRRKTAGYAAGICALGASAVYARRKYNMQRQRHR